MDVHGGEGYLIMSYQSGSATDLDDLMSQLDTFLTGTPGWTQYLFDGTNRRAVYGKPASPELVSRLVQFQWDNSAGNLGLSMIGGYTGNTTWNLQTEPEFTSSIITSCRYCNVMTGPFPSYHFFEDDHYFHVVVEISSGLYRHFGFGQSQLLGALKGGAYIYGHYWAQGISTIDTPLSSQHAAHFDGYNVSSAVRGCGMHVLGMTGLYDPNTKYFRNYSGYTTNDGDGDKIGTLAPGGWRGGSHSQFMAQRSSDLNGFKPLIPVPMFYANTFAAPDTYALMGYISDIRWINMYGLNSGESVTVGADTWVVFPITRKGNNGLSYDQEQSYNFGVAYKKVTT
jgi:hypothetical protein